MSFNEIPPHILTAMNEEQAEDAIEALLYAELRRLEIPSQALKISTITKAKDGGVDARVECGEDKFLAAREIIPHPLTCYQIKSGSINLSDSEIRELLCGRKTSNPIYPRLKDCLDKGGHIVFCLFANDSCDQEKDGELLERFYGKLAKIYGNRCENRIHLWQTGALIRLFKYVPALVLKINSRTGWPMWHHDEWDAEVSEMRYPLVEEDDYDKNLNGLQNALTQDAKTPRHFRVLGEPGVGKTRLVFEALGIDPLKQDALYVKSPVVMETPEIRRAVRTAPKGASLTLVIDECPYDQANDLWAYLKGCEYPLNLITIYNEIEEEFREEEPSRIKLNKFDNESVEKILINYAMPPHIAAKVIELCEGSPRAAHIFGRSYAKNPQGFEEDALSKERYKSLWLRYIAGESQIGSDICRKRELVLSFLALFQKFGAEGQYAAEKDAIFDLIEAITPGSVSRDEFHKIINSFRRLKILQGDSTYYITPKALHIRYWDEFWAQYAASFDIDKHLEPLKGKLEEWWRRMFQYTNGSESAVKVVEWLLSADGPFFKKKDFLLSERGTALLLILTEVRPELSVTVLYHILKNYSQDELRSYENRRGIVHALDFLLLFNSTFEHAAWTLFKLAEAENETWANNSTGVLADAFHFFSQSEVSFDKRFNIFKELLANQPSDSAGEKVLLNILDKLLNVHHSFTVIPEERIRLASLTYSEPKHTRDGQAKAHEQVWKYALELCENRSITAQETIAVNLCHHLRSYIAVLGKNAFTDMKKLYDGGAVPKGQLLKIMSTIIHYDLDTDGYSAAIKESALKLKAELEGNSFNERLERYVKFRIFEEEYSEKQGAADRLKKETSRLADEIIKDPSQFVSELSWLTSSVAENAGRLGYELGSKDHNFALWPLLKKHQQPEDQKGETSLIGCYLGAIADQKDFDTHYKMVCELRQTKLFHPFLTHIIWRSHLDDRTAAIVTDIIESGEASYRELHVMSMGMCTQKLSPKTLHRWVDFLLTVNAQDAAFLSVSLAQHYLGDNVKEPKRDILLAIKAVNHPALFEKSGKKQYNAMTSYYWSRLAIYVLNEAHSEAFALFGRCLESQGNKGSLFDRFYDKEVNDFLTAYLEKHPEKAWQSIEPLVSEKTLSSSRAYHLLHWLSGQVTRGSDEAGRKTPVDQIPYKLIKEWIDKDRNQRALDFAHYFMRALDTYPIEQLVDSNSHIAQFISDFGSNPEVRDSLQSSPYGYLWSGPQSLMVAKKIENIEKILKSATEQNLRSALEEMLKRCKEWQSNALKSEERDEY